MLTPASRRADFPSLEGRAYLNTAAESIPPLTVREALHTYWDHKTLGMKGRDFHYAELAAARAAGAALLHRSPDEVAFCSCASEAYSLLATAIEWRSGDEVVVTDLEFPSGATPWLMIPGRPAVRLWQNRGGVLDPDDLRHLLNGRTRLVQISLVSFLSGHRVRWAPIRDLVRDLAPDAILSVDVTQAFGRVDLDCLDADCLIGSSYKWLLGIHGGAVVSIPAAAVDKVTARAGGWYHLVNAFEADRFTRAEPRPGAASFATGMPAFPAVYALRSSMEYLAGVGIANIAAHADPLVLRVHEGLEKLGIAPMSPPQPGNSSGIVSFRHSRDAEIHAALVEQNIHVMCQAGRLRVAVHGYNTSDDVNRLLGVLGKFA